MVRFDLQVLSFFCSTVIFCHAENKLFDLLFSDWFLHEPFVLFSFVFPNVTVAVIIVKDWRFCCVWFQFFLQRQYNLFLYCSSFLASVGHFVGR